MKIITKKKYSKMDEKAKEEESKISVYHNRKKVTVRYRTFLAELEKCKKSIEIEDLEVNKKYTFVVLETQNYGTSKFPDMRSNYELRTEKFIGTTKSFVKFEDSKLSQVKFLALLKG